jgi:hypothetical protein
MLTPELETAIRNSLEDATRRGHEFAALEHLLLALLGDEKTAEVVKHLRWSVSRLSGKLEAFLESELKPLPESERERSQPTLAFARVIQRAVNHVLGAGQGAGLGGQRAGGDVLGARLVRRHVPEGRGDHAAGRGQLHLARHLEAVAGQDHRSAGAGGRPSGRRRRGRRGARSTRWPSTRST